MLKRIVAFLICFFLVFEQAGFAQVAGPLGVPNYLANLLPAERFRPLHLRSLSFDPENNNFDLLLDKGDTKSLAPAQLQSEAEKLMQYFRIGLALPNGAFWVNLRPDAPTDIIDISLGKTDIGKVMLEADLQLKKDIAAFTSPDTPEGKQYWDKLYAQAEALFGPANVTIPTLTRPWIVPGEIIIRQGRDSAYIYKATLSVMLEQDYLKDSAQFRFDDPRLKQLNDYSSGLVRKIILPKLIKAINSSKRYAALRQVYYSLILAQWYKNRWSSDEGKKNAPRELADSVDSCNLKGLISKQPWAKDSYFKAYQKSFANGEYNRKESVYGAYGLGVRRYFSGGIALQAASLISGTGTTLASFKNKSSDYLTSLRLHSENNGPRAGKDVNDIQPRIGSEMTFLGEAKIGGEKQKEFWADEKGQLWIFKINPYADQSYRPLGVEAYYAFVKRLFPAHPVIVSAEDPSGRDRSGTLEKVILKQGAPPIDKTLDAQAVGKYYHAYAVSNLKAAMNTGLIDMTSLTHNQIEQVLREMVIDWLFSNHDSHPANFLIDEQGMIIGIDKEQAFKYFLNSGKDALDLNNFPNGMSFAPLYYAVVVNLAAKGQLSPELIDSVLNRIDGITDEEMVSIIRPFAKEYAHATGVSEEVFIRKFLERKRSLRNDFEKFFAKVSMTHAALAMPDIDLKQFFSIEKKEYAEFLDNKLPYIKQFMADDALPVSAKPPKMFFTFLSHAVEKVPVSETADQQPVFHGQPGVIRGLSALYGMARGTIGRLKESVAPAIIIGRLLEEYYEELLRAPSFTVGQRQSLDEMKKRLIEFARAPPGEIKRLKIKFTLLAAWVAEVRQRKSDFHRVYLARDAGFFYLLDCLIEQEEGAESYYDAGASVYYLSRSRMSGESSNRVYSKMKNIISEAQGTVPQKDLQSLYRQIRIGFRQEYERDEQFRAVVDAVYAELQETGYGTKDKLVFVDTGFLGTIPFFLKNVLDLHKQEWELTDESGEERVQIAIIQPSSISSFAKDLLGFDLEMFAPEERERIEDLARPFGEGKDLGSSLEDIRAHPVRFDENEWEIQYTDAATQLEFFYEQVVAVLAFFERRSAIEAIAGDKPESVRRAVSRSMISQDLKLLLDFELTKNAPQDFFESKPEYVSILKKFLDNSQAYSINTLKIPEIVHFSFAPENFAPMHFVLDNTIPEQFVSIVSQLFKQFFGIEIDRNLTLEEAVVFFRGVDRDLQEEMLDSLSRENKAIVSNILAVYAQKSEDGHAREESGIKKDGGDRIEKIIRQLEIRKVLLAAYRISGNSVEKIFDINEQSPAGATYYELPLEQFVPGYLESGTVFIPRSGPGGERSELPAVFLEDAASGIVLLVHADRVAQARKVPAKALDGGEEFVPAAAAEELAAMIMSGKIDEAAEMVFSKVDYGSFTSLERIKKYLADARIYLSSVKTAVSSDPSAWERFSLALIRYRLAQVRKQSQISAEQYYGLKDMLPSDSMGAQLLEIAKEIAVLQKVGADDPRGIFDMLDEFGDSLGPEVIDSGVVYKPEQLSVREVLDESVKQAGQDQPVKVSIEGDAQATTYRFLLHEVLLNFVTNGLKYYDKNKDKPSIKITVKEEAGSIIIDYEDNGLGMDERMKQYVLTGKGMLPEAQTQGRAINRTGQGSGIVLSALNILRGRYVDFDSAPGTGTRFTVSIARTIEKQHSASLDSKYSTIKHDILNKMTPARTVAGFLLEENRDNREVRDFYYGIEKSYKTLEEIGVVLALSEKDGGDYFDFYRSVSGDYRIPAAEDNGHLDKWFAGNEDPDNEEITQQIRSSKGAYVGVAYNGINLSRAAQGDFDSVTILDINPFVAEFFMPLRSALISRARNRAEFLAILCSVRLSPEELGDLQEASLEQIELVIDDKLSSVSPEERTAKMQETWDSIEGEFPAQLAAKIRESWIHYSMGPDKKPSRNPFRFYQVVRSMGTFDSWLSSEASFRKIKEMVGQGRILGLTADWTDQNIFQGNLSEKFRQNGQSVSVVYISNIVEWWGSAAREKSMVLFNNIASLPLAEGAVLLFNSKGKTLMLRDIDSLATEQMVERFNALLGARGESKPGSQDGGSRDKSRRPEDIQSALGRIIRASAEASAMRKAQRQETEKLTDEQMLEQLRQDPEVLELLRQYQPQEYEKILKGFTSDMLTQFYGFASSNGRRFDFSSEQSNREKEDSLGKVFLWLATNEDWQSSLEAVSRLMPGGVYVGPGCGGQNFSRLVHGDFEMAIIVDINPYVGFIYMPLEAALLARARNRIEYFSLLTGVQLSEQDVAELADDPQAGRKVSLRKIIERIIQEINENTRDERRENIERIWETIEDAFPEESGIRQAVGEFWEIYAGTAEGHAKRAVGRLERILKAMERGDSWLSSESNFLKLRKMFLQGRIKGMVGDFSSRETMESVKSVMEKSEPKLGASLVYISNIAGWMEQMQDTARIDNMKDNIGILPLSKDAILISSRLNPDRSEGSDHGFTTFIEPLLRTPNDVIKDASQAKQSKDGGEFRVKVEGYEPDECNPAKTWKSYAPLLGRDPGSGSMPAVTEETLAISELIITQPFITAKELGARIKENIDGKAQPIVVMKLNGKLYIGDGHHRVAAAYLRGDRSIAARVLEMPADAASLETFKQNRGDINALIVKHGEKDISLYSLGFEESTPQEVVFSVLSTYQAYRRLAERSRQRGSGKDGGEQAVGDDKKLSGIDFRSMPISTESMVQPQGAIIHQAINPLVVKELEKEWAAIDAQVRAGQVPFDKLKSYASSCRSQNCPEQMEQVLSCIAGMLRLEEECAVQTPKELREVLAALAG